MIAPKNENSATFVLVFDSAITYASRILHLKKAIKFLTTVFRH